MGLRKASCLLMLLVLPACDVEEETPPTEGNSISPVALPEVTFTETTDVKVDVVYESVRTYPFTG